MKLFSLFFKGKRITIQFVGRGVCIGENIRMSYLCTKIDKCLYTK